MSSLSSIIHLAPSGIAKPEGASVFLNLEGKKISASPMVGTKTEVKDATLIGYSDIAAVDESKVGRGWRSFDVLPGSEKVLQASGRDLNNVMAVLVVDATVLLDPPNFKAMLESPDMSDTIGPMFGEHAGLIVKHSFALAGERRTLAEVVISLNRRWKLRRIFPPSSGPKSRRRPRGKT